MMVRIGLHSLIIGVCCQLLLGGVARADYACFAGCMNGTLPSSARISQPSPLVCLPICGYKPTIDYHCVGVCAAAGSPGGKCLQQCSFYPSDIVKMPLGDLASPHNQFSAPVPVNPSDLIPNTPAVAAAATPKERLSPTTQPLSPSTNYKLINQCLQAGYLYGYCLSTSRY